MKTVICYRCGFSNPVKQYLFVGSDIYNAKQECLVCSETLHTTAIDSEEVETYMEAIERTMTEMKQVHDKLTSIKSSLNQYSYN